MYQDPKIYDKFQVLSKAEAFFYEMCFLDRQSILELACGSGRVGKVFSEQNYLGVDLSYKMLKQYRKIDAHCKLIQADISKLPIKNQFDGIVFNLNSIHHLNEPDLAKLWLEIQRISSDDCLLLIEMTDFNAIDWLNESYYNQYYEYSSGRGLLLKQKIYKIEDHFLFEREYFDQDKSILKEESTLYSHDIEKINLDLKKIGFKKLPTTNLTPESSDNKDSSLKMLLYSK